MDGEFVQNAEYRELAAPAEHFGSSCVRSGWRERLEARRGRHRRKGFAYRDLMSRYVVEHSSGFTRMLWRVRACLIDAETDETLEARTQKVADDLRRVLERVDAGELEPLPADASPFRRYEASAGLDGWHYLLRAEGALDHESFARTRSETLAKRAVEALNRDNPRRLRDPHGPTKAGWF